MLNSILWCELVKYSTLAQNGQKGPLGPKSPKN